VEAKATLENGADEWDGGWTKMVGLWWGLERSTGFVSSVRGRYLSQVFDAEIIP
jgi:hypothetical protein